jgi:hypothetical protein
MKFKNPFELFENREKKNIENIVEGNRNMKADGEKKNRSVIWNILYSVMVIVMSILFVIVGLYPAYQMEKGSGQIIQLNWKDTLSNVFTTIMVIFVLDIFFLLTLIAIETKHKYSVYNVLYTTSVMFFPVILTSFLTLYLFNVFENTLGYYLISSLPIFGSDKMSDIMSNIKKQELSHLNKDLDLSFLLTFFSISNFYDEMKLMKKSFKYYFDLQKASVDEDGVNPEVLKDTESKYLDFELNKNLYTSENGIDEQEFENQMSELEQNIYDIILNKHYIGYASFLTFVNIFIIESIQLAQRSKVTLY